MTERPFNVRIKMRGAARPFTWTNVFAADEFEAVERAIDERYWPPVFTETPVDGPFRLTITVTPVLPSPNPTKESEMGSDG